MYLISIYFDEKTDKHIRSLMKQVAKKTGNTYMVDGNVPPHITTAAFETHNIKAATDAIESAAGKLKKFRIIWASVGTFLPHVIFLAPVLGENLHHMAEVTHDALKEVPSIRLLPNYQPFHWMPHTTIAKKLTPEEMRIAFEVLQNSFGKFEGSVTGIGLAKTSPYTDIKTWELGGIKS